MEVFVGKVELAHLQVYHTKLAKGDALRLSFVALHRPLERILETFDSLVVSLQSPLRNAEVIEAGKHVLLV